MAEYSSISDVEYVIAMMIVSLFLGKVRREGGDGELVYHSYHQQQPHFRFFSEKNELKISYF